MKQNRHHSQQPRTAKRSIRTCVGCGLRDEARGMARLGLAGGKVTVEAPLGRAKQRRGRGAHVHPRAGCLTRASRGLARAFGADVRTDASELGRRLIASSEAAMVALLVSARRRGAVTASADGIAHTNAHMDAPTPGAALTIVACDAFLPSDGDANRGDVLGAAPSFPAIAWRTKRELGALLGGGAVAHCAVLDAGIAAQLVIVRAAVDAGREIAGVGREGAECSRCPEAR